MVKSERKFGFLTGVSLELTLDHKVLVDMQMACVLRPAALTTGSDQFELARMEDMKFRFGSSLRFDGKEVETKPRLWTVREVEQTGLMAGVFERVAHDGSLFKGELSKTIVLRLWQFTLNMEGHFYFPLSMPGDWRDLIFFPTSMKKHLKREARKPIERIECPFCDGLIHTAFPVFWRHVAARHADMADGIVERKDKLSWARSLFEAGLAAAKK
jgi:hypothetical protein